MFKIQKTIYIFLSRWKVTLCQIWVHYVLETLHGQEGFEVVQKSSEGSGSERRQPTLKSQLCYMLPV